MAKAALKEIFPGRFQEMAVYRCELNTAVYHHGHRVPERFRESDLSSCRNCEKVIRRDGADSWLHEDGSLQCEQPSWTGEPLVATPFWKTYYTNL
jgi:hypothetical protein